MPQTATVPVIILERGCDRTGSVFTYFHSSISAPVGSRGVGEQGGQGDKGTRVAADDLFVGSKADLFPITDRLSATEDKSALARKDRLSAATSATENELALPPTDISSAATDAQCPMTFD